MSDVSASLPADYTDPTPTLEKAAKSATAGLRDASKERDAAIAGKAGVIKEETDSEKGYQTALDKLEKHAPQTLELKPWEQPAPKNDPVRSFGSWASALGIIAGAVTKTGLASSLNASAAAMNAIRTQDWDAYHEAKQVWKDNTEIAIKNSEAEYKSYMQAFDMMKENHAAGMAFLQTKAAQFDNQAVLAMAKANDVDGIWKIATGLNTAVQNGAKTKLEMEQAGQKIEETKTRMDLFKQWKEAHPSATPEDSARALTAIMSPQYSIAQVKAVTGGSARNNRLLTLADDQNKEIQEATKTLKGTELDDEIARITQKYDEQRRLLYAPKDVPGASKDIAEVKQIDDLDPILDAMEALINYDPSTVGVRARGNRILGSIKGQLGEEISDSQMRAEQVQQLANMAFGPMSQIFTGTGQWTKSRELITRAIDDPTSMMSAPDQAVQDIETIRQLLPDMRKRRMDILGRKLPAKGPSVGGDFKTPDDVRAAVQSGKLTHDEATKILKEKFGYTD